MNGVNLIPASRRQAASQRTRFRLWLCITGGTAMIAIAGTLVFRTFWTLDAGPVLTEIAATEALIETTEQRLSDIRREITALRREDLAAKTVGEHPDWSILLLAINQVRGEGVALESFRLVQELASPSATPSPAPEATPAPPSPGDRYSVKLRGIATDIAGVMAFVEQLERLRVLESVVLKQSRAEQNRGVVVTGFEIECTLVERAPPKSAAPATADATATETRP